jgi:NADPH-dependent glutamate synthase beta subunit-like oxidoreductase
VLLASGAWRDRPLPVDGAEELIGQGFEYQNPLVRWYNHHLEPGYPDREIEIPDGAVVIGGGLASIDVAKICQFETYGRALRERGIEADLVDLEKQGIPAVCEAHGIDPDELGIRGATILYRRRRRDMPLVTPPPGASPEQVAKTIATREKLLARAQLRYLFRVMDRVMPLRGGLVVEDGRVAGVRIVRTEVEGREVRPIEGSERTLETRLVISSIGSVPEPVEGIRMSGETFDFQNSELGVYDEEAGIFGVGNVVTGQGNIRASLLHARKVAAYLGENLFAGAVGAAGAEVVRSHLRRKPPLPPERVEALLARVTELQRRVGYDGNYPAWVTR